MADQHNKVSMASSNRTATTMASSTDNVEELRTKIDESLAQGNATDPDHHPGLDVFSPATVRDRSIQDSSSDSAPNLEKTGGLNGDEPPSQWDKLAQKHPGPWDHPSITLGPPIIILFDIVVPCIIYYTWFDIHHSQWIKSCKPYTNTSTTCPFSEEEYNKDILGYAIISFGFGELYILIARVWRLLAQSELCAPLLSRSRWELDATSWVYAVAMLMALIPFVIGSTLAIPRLYLYSPAFLMAFLGCLMVATLTPIKLPIGINSHARGTPLRPFIYYAAEDFIAVDGLQDRDFRERYNKRYNSSADFRRMFLLLTLWWIFGVCAYIGCLSAVIWTLEFHMAFGLSLGILFSYIGIWAGCTVWYVNYAMKREKRKVGYKLHLHHSRHGAKAWMRHVHVPHMPRMSLDGLMKKSAERDRERGRELGRRSGDVERGHLWTGSD